MVGPWVPAFAGMTGWDAGMTGAAVAEGWWVIFVAMTMWFLVESALVQGVGDVFTGLRPAGWQVVKATADRPLFERARTPVRQQPRLPLP